MIRGSWLAYGVDECGIFFVFLAVFGEWFSALFAGVEGDFGALGDDEVVGECFGGLSGGDGFAA